MELLIAGRRATAKNYCRKLSLLLAALAFSQAGSGASDPASGLEYNVEADDTITVTGCTVSPCNPTTVTVPATIDGKPVRKIANNAFDEVGLTAVTLPDGLVEIGDFSFQKNSLTSLVLPNTVTKLGTAAFGENQITSLQISENLTEVGTYAFWNNNLSSATIPANLTSFIGIYYGNQNLSTLTFAGNPTSISADFCFDCDFTSFVIPDSVETIEGTAFQRNDNLASVTLPKNLKSIGTSAFARIGAATIDFPEGLESIGSNAFTNGALTQLKLPSTLTTIGITVFTGNSIQKLDLSQVGDISWTQTLFNNNQIDEVLWPHLMETIPTSFLSNNSLSSLDGLPPNLTAINNSAFANNNLLNIVIPASVVTVEDNSFIGNAVETIKFLGDRTAGIGDNIAPNAAAGLSISYCNGRSGWPGSDINGVTPTPSPDCDGDGIDDGSDPFPNARTGISSSLANLSTTPTAGSSCNIHDLRALDTGAASPPAGRTGPASPVEFFLNQCATGESIEITLAYPNASPLRKDGSGAISSSAGTVQDVYQFRNGAWELVTGASLSGNTITITVVDNGPLDLDPRDGIIRSNASIFSGVVGSIPVLPLPLLLLLGLGFVGLVWRALGAGAKAGKL